MRAQLKRHDGGWLVTVDAHEVGLYARMTDAIRQVEALLYPVERRHR